jgi:Zn-dependent peptidase ImmA (M78 family)
MMPNRAPVLSALLVPLWSGVKHRSGSRFTFFHEAGHVLLHRKRELFIEEKRRQSDTQPSSEWLRYEEEADRFASRVLIPQKYHHDFAI